MGRLFLFICAAVITSTLAAIGPVANVHVRNKVISPDGFSRSYVLFVRCRGSVLTFISAVLAGSTTTNVGFPGPLIRGRQV